MEVRSGFSKLLMVTSLLLLNLTPGIATASKMCTPPAKGTPKVCDCGHETHTIYEYTWTDEFAKPCKYTSDSCLCAPHPPASTGDSTLPTPQPARNLPGGTYKESCQACERQGSMLECTCNARGGQRHRSSLNIESCGDGRDKICNLEGRLRCPGPC